ncbi:MAG: acetyl-CoA carboxylase biotin carboxyl carrier protein subunit [bacterium]
MSDDIQFENFTVDETTFRTQLTRKYLARKPYVPADPKKVFAFIPGTIVKIFVKENHKVKKGEELLALQAMKMNNHLIAPDNGTVKKIHVKQGDVVVKNQLLVELK